MRCKRQRQVLKLLAWVFFKFLLTKLCYFVFSFWCTFLPSLTIISITSSISFFEVLKFTMQALKQYFSITTALDKNTSPPCCKSLSKVSFSIFNQVSLSFSGGTSKGTYLKVAMLKFCVTASSSGCF